MNIPSILLNDRKIISSEVYNYYQSIAQRLIMNKRNSEVNIKSNYSKEKIKNWFMNLSLKEKFKICSIYNNWFSNIIFQLLEYSGFESVIEFCPTDVYKEFKKHNIDEINCLKNGLNEILKNENKNFEHFITFFTAENNVKKLSGIPDDYELLNINKKFHMEKLFLAELRFITLDEFNDTISFSKDLFNHPERLFEFFNYFSENQCFKSIINPIQEKNNNYNFSLPEWIYSYKTYSLYQILIIFFEQIISVYYQLYLYEKVLLKFNIEQKFNEFFKNNENLKDYLSKKVKIINDDFIVDKIKCLDLINSEPIRNKYEYFENKTKNIFSFAFGSSFYDQKLDTKREFNLKFYHLMDLAKKNSDDFIDKISFIEAKDSFKFLNFIYFVIYQQLIEQCSDECYKELLKEETNKTQKQPTSAKSKKNKKKRKKKKKQGNKELKIENNNNNDNNDDLNDEDEEVKIKNIENNNEEEIEEIPSDFIIHPKTEHNLNELESNNNNIINNNDINNSTVSSTYTNNYSKDYNNNSLGPRYNNFIKCEKKESEMLLEIKDFSDDKSDESDDEKDRNNKIELEDISEHDISKENINIEDSNNIQVSMEENKKKKKKHKKRNKKKKNKILNENLDESISKINANNNLEEKAQNNKVNKDKKIESQKIERIKELKEPEIIQNEIKDIGTYDNDIQNIPSVIEEKCENNNINEKTKESQKESKEKIKRKNNKDFFLYPVNINKKKEKIINIKKKEKIEVNMTTDIKNDCNASQNNIISKTEKRIKTFNLQDSIKEKIFQNNSLKNYEINKVANISINSYNKEKKEVKEYENKFLIDNQNQEILKKYENIFFLNQQPFPNSFFYENSNNSLIVFQNKLFSNLGKDILEFQKCVESNLRDISNYREQIINKFKAFILDILQKNYFIKFFFYGSYSTGLSIESSDIDILLKFQIKEKNKEFANDSKKNIHDLIFLLNEEFTKQKYKLEIIKINPIYTASIPVLKVECNLKDIIPSDIQKKLLSKNYLFDFENELMKLNFDFTFFEVEDVNEEISIPSQEIIHFIKEKIKIYPIIKPTILVLKRYMQIQKLNSSYQGGISSFSLFLLLASYNKQIFYENKYLEIQEDFENFLGQIFYGFFLFYSNFNFGINCIDLRHDNPIYLLKELNENKINIIDPITGLNAAKSTFRIEAIKEAFNNVIIVINKIFYDNINFIDNNIGEKNILRKIFAAHNFTNYFY